MLILEELSMEDLKKAVNDIKNDIFASINELESHSISIAEWDKYDDEDSLTELLLSLNSMKCQLEELEAYDDREDIESLIKELYISMSLTEDFKMNDSRWLQSFDHTWI